MKPGQFSVRSLFAFSLVFSAISGSSSAHGASSRIRQIEIWVAAELTDEGAGVSRPTREQPAYYVAYDAGLIEAGDCIAGDKAPTPIAVGQALQSALESQGYAPAVAPEGASLVLIYHWGSIRPYKSPKRSRHKIEPNLKARLALVAPSLVARSIENYILHQKSPSDVDRAFPVPTILGSDLGNTLALARDSLYFVVISAYDRAALSRNEKNLLWRIKVTAPERAGALHQVVPTLINGSAAYYGTDHALTQSFETPLVPKDSAQGTSAAPVLTADSNSGGGLDAGFIQKIIKQEHDAFSGEEGASLDDKPRRNLKQPAQSNPARSGKR